MRKLDFHQISKDLNTLKDAHKEYSQHELSQVLSMANLPISPEFRKQLVAHKVLEVANRGKEGITYKFIGDSIFYLNIESAYRDFRKSRNKYLHGLKNKNDKPVVANSDDDESLIQAAIKLLKAQGDRFKITEKIVTVAFKDL